jgi:hypothetical protein
VKLASKTTIGIATAIVLVAGVFGFALYLRALERDVLSIIARPADEAPAELLVKIRRAANVPPDLSLFILPRTEDGNAASIILQNEHGNDLARLRALERLHQKLLVEDSLHPDERALWDEVVSDPMLEQYVAAASQKRYATLDIMMADQQNLSEPKLMYARAPDYRGIRIGALALTLRAHRHRLHGELDQAARDIGAVLSLGHHILTRSPTITESTVGRVILQPALTELAHYADARDDIALAEKVSWLGLWGDRTVDFGQLLSPLPMMPDFALRIAADTSLWTAVRVQALNMIALGQVVRAKHVLSGADERVIRGVEGLVNSPDPQFAKAAQITLGTLEWFDDLGPWGRLKFVRSSIQRMVVIH